MALVADPGEGLLREIRALLDRAFVSDPLTESDWEHCQGGTHVLRHVGDELVGYAAVVSRTLWVDSRPVRCGYVEGMAVAPEHQRAGHGRAIMAEVASVIADGPFELGALASSEEGVPLYEAVGWRRWTGPLSACTAADAVERTPDEEGWIFVRAEAVDLGAPLTCDWRSGEVW